MSTNRIDIDRLTHENRILRRTTEQLERRLSDLQARVASRTTPHSWHQATGGTPTPRTYAEMRDNLRGQEATRRRETQRYHEEDSGVRHQNHLFPPNFYETPRSRFPISTNLHPVSFVITFYLKDGARFYSQVKTFIAVSENELSADHLSAMIQSLQDTHQLRYIPNALNTANSLFKSITGTFSKDLTTVHERIFNIQSIQYYDVDTEDAFKQKHFPRQSFAPAPNLSNPLE